MQSESFTSQLKFDGEQRRKLMLPLSLLGTNWRSRILKFAPASASAPRKFGDNVMSKALRGRRSTHSQTPFLAHLSTKTGFISSTTTAKPGTYSLRCLRVIRDIQQKDADIFTRFCTFLWMFPGNGLLPIIPNKDDQHISSVVEFTDFLHLEDMGLIQFGQITGFSLKGLKGRTISIFYYSRHHRVTLPADKDDFPLGCALLTSVGSELSPIAGSGFSEDYRQSVIGHWRGLGFTVDEL